jgi:hypothetical protein
MATTLPSDTGVPNSSARACAVRALDSNCPTYRYTMIAVTLGPYCTGAATPSGAVPQVVTPHRQRRATNWCSTTSIRIAGRSNSCRRCTPISGAPARSAPHLSVRIGHRLRSRPRMPRLPTRPLTLLPRNDRGAGLSNGESDDGGRDEFRLFEPNRRRSSATSASSPTIRSACRTTTAASSS